MSAEDEGTLGLDLTADFTDVGPLTEWVQHTFMAGAHSGLLLRVEPGGDEENPVVVMELHASLLTPEETVFMLENAAVTLQKAIDEGQEDQS